MQCFETMLKCDNCVTSLFTNRCIASCLPRNIHHVLFCYTMNRSFMMSQILKKSHKENVIILSGVSVYGSIFQLSCSLYTVSFGEKI